MCRNISKIKFRKKNGRAYCCVLQTNRQSTQLVIRFTVVVWWSKTWWKNQVEILHEQISNKLNDVTSNHGKNIILCNERRVSWNLSLWRWGKEFADICLCVFFYENSETYREIHMEGCKVKYKSIAIVV